MGSYMNTILESLNAFGYFTLEISVYVFLCSRWFKVGRIWRHPAQLSQLNLIKPHRHSTDEADKQSV